MWRCPVPSIGQEPRSAAGGPAPSVISGFSNGTQARGVATMSDGIKTIIFPVRDIEAAKGIFTELVGAEPYADMPYYVGYRIGEQEIGLDPNGHKTGMTGPIGYWEVDDIKAVIQTLS